jgi:hypothetical protein
LKWLRSAASNEPFFGAFWNLRIATVSFVMSVCPSAWNISAPLFMKLYICVFFEDLSRKFKFLKKCDRNNGTLHEADQYKFVIICRSFLRKMRSVSDESCRENQDAHFLFSYFFSLENRAVYKIIF